MELIYMDKDFKELGIISDFTIDLAYGKDENDFEIKTPENEMLQGYYWYIKDEEYGGIIDEIDAQTNTKEVIYKGRSWQGILNSYSGLQLKYANREGVVVKKLGASESDYLFLNGNLKLILDQILNEDLGLDVEISETLEETIEVRVLANQKLYDLLRDVCTQLGLKVKTYFEEGKWYVDLVHNVNYTQGQYFDTSQYSITAKSSTAIPNHLIGVYKKEGQPIIKHIYTDAEGNVQPYYVLDPIHDAPAYNEEYERCPDNKVVTGKDEIVEVIEAGSTVERYDKVSPLIGRSLENPHGTSGNTPFIFKSNGDPIEPVDWKDKYYEDYYHLKKDNQNKLVFDSEGNLIYELYEFDNQEMGDYEAFKPNEVMSTYIWGNSWQSYYKKVEDSQSGWGYKFEPLSESDVQVTSVKEIANINLANNKVRPQPIDWETTYKNYFIRFTDTSGHQTFESVTGVTGSKWQKQTKPYTADRQNYFKQHIGEYYYKWHFPKWKVEIWTKVKGKWKKAQVPKASDSNIDIDLKDSSVFYVKDSLKNAKVFGTMTLFEAIQEFGVYTSNKTRVGSLTKKEWLFTRKIKVQYGSVKYIVHPQTTYKTDYISMDDYAKRTGQKKSKLKYEANKFYMKVSTEGAPSWSKSRGDGGYYFVDVKTNSIPDYYATYYKFTDACHPLFSLGWTYKKVKDDYGALCEAMLKRLEELKAQAQTIEPTLDTEIQEFDVGDIVGGVHPFTKQKMTTAITKKIVKGGTFGLNVDYEIG